MALIEESTSKGSLRQAGASAQKFLHMRDALLYLIAVRRNTHVLLENPNEVQRIKINQLRQGLQGNVPGKLVFQLLFDPFYRLLL